MMEEKHKNGRPLLTLAQKAQRRELLLQKIEPYVKSGLSVRKSIVEAKIANSSFYKLMYEDEEFRDEIERYKNFISILANNAIFRHLLGIVEKQNGNPKKGTKPQELSSSDVSFLQWFALNSNNTKTEWGERKDINMFDPEVEIQKIKSLIEENSSKELPPLQA